MGKPRVPFEYTPTDDQEWPVVLEEVGHCASTWEPGVRVLGDVRAGDIARAVREALELRSVVIGPLPIVKTPGVCGGSARLATTRIPVWTLVVLWKQKASDAQVLLAFPQLRQCDLDEACQWWEHHPDEVEADIEANEAE